MNELLWIAEIVILFAAVIVLYRYFGVAGLFGWIAFVAIIANIQVQKLIVVFGIETTLGNVIYATTFLATDILTENHGRKVANQSVMFGFIVLVLANLVMTMTLLFEPSSNDQIQSTMVELFRLFPRITIASMLAYGISQMHDVWLYSLLKSRLPQLRYLWLRNNASTIVSQIIDSFVFVGVAFFGERSFEVILGSAVVIMVLKIGVSLLDTPIVYLAKHIGMKHHSGAANLRNAVISKEK